MRIPISPQTTALRLACTAWLATTLLLSGCSRGERLSLTPVWLPCVSDRTASEPAVRIDPRNRDVLVTWLSSSSGTPRVWFARSTDHGVTWSEPVPVTPPGEPIRRREDASPRMNGDGQGRVAVSWSTWVDVPGRAEPASDVRFSRSVDGGVTWSSPITLNDDYAAAPGLHSYHDMAATEDGHLAVAWLDSRPGGDGAASDSGRGGEASVHYVMSSDFGGSWSGNSAQWSHACPKCRVAVSMDFTGMVFVSFRRHSEGNVRDVVVGRPDGPPVLVYADRWATDDCPRSGPALRVPRDHTLRMAWYTGAPGRTGVWFRHAIPETYDSTVTPLAIVTGDSLPPTHVSLGTAGPWGSVMACDADPTGGGKLSLVRVEPSGHRIAERHVPLGTSGVVRPQVATSNRDRNAYVVWTEEYVDRTRVRMLRWELGR